MLEVLQYQFMQNALIAGLLAAVACGIVGVYVVVKGLSSSAVVSPMPPSEVSAWAT
jgi:ABC-type Mn2+/Zn2+ transport system permease subunit